MRPSDKVLGRDGCSDPHVATKALERAGLAPADIDIWEMARPSEMTLYSVSELARPLSSRPLDPRDAD
jgi:hypothetical protein